MANHGGKVSAAAVPEKPGGAAVRVSGETMLGEMKTYAHLKPGQDGTKRLVEQYGSQGNWPITS